MAQHRRTEGLRSWKRLVNSELICADGGDGEKGTVRAEYAKGFSVVAPTPWARSGRKLGWALEVIRRYNEAQRVGIKLVLPDEQAWLSASISPIGPAPSTAAVPLPSSLAPLKMLSPSPSPMPM